LGPELGLITLSSSLFTIVPLPPSPLLLRLYIQEMCCSSGFFSDRSDVELKRTEYEKELEIKYLRINFIIKIAGTTLVVSVGKARCFQCRGPRFNSWRGN